MKRSAKLLKAICLAAVLAALLPPFVLAAAAAPAKGGGAPAPAAPAADPTTTDLSGLRLSEHLITITLRKGAYEVTEFLSFQNQGKATIVSKDGAPTLRLSLPRSNNVQNPEAVPMGAPAGLDPKRIQLIGNQIISTEPIPPGSKVIVYQYRLADEFGGIHVQRPIFYGTDRFALLPEKGKVQTTADGLVPGKVVKFQEKEWNRFNGLTRAGTVLSFSLKAPDSMGGLQIFYMAIGGLAVVGGVLGFWIRRRRSGALALQVEREQLLRAIAALDDRLAQGEMAPEAHRRERASRFARLRELSS